jgi:glycosyltransferase involved in cell wall biosynthesis
MRRPLVVQVCEYVPTGARTFDRFLLGLADGVVQQGIDIHFVFGGEAPLRFGHALAQVGAGHSSAPLPLTRLRDVVDLGKSLRRLRPALIQTHFLSVFDRTLPLLKIVSGAPCLIVTDHTSGHGPAIDPLREIATVVRSRLFSGFVDRVVAVSDFVRRRDVDLLKFPSDRAEVIHNGVDVSIESIAPEVEPTDEPRASFRIAYAGRLIRDKGVATLLNAVSLLGANGREFELRIAGDGDFRTELESLARASGFGGRVRFLGNIDNVPALFRWADAVVVPSNYGEALSLVVLEAMACGACVVAARDGGIPEALGTDRETGRLFDPGNAEQLRDVLLEVADAPAERARMSANARARVIARFTLARMVEDHLKTIRSLMPGP